MNKLREEFGFIQGNYLVLVLSWILMDFAMELPGTYYPLYVLALGGSATIIGLIGFASFIALASVQFPGGYLADRFGRRWLITTMTFGMALSFILYAVAPSWHWILIGALINSLCLIYQPALMAMIADSVPSERRGMGFSIITLIERTASTPAPAIAGLLFLMYGLVGGMRIGYGVVVALFLTAALLRIRLRETVKTVEKPRAKDIVGSYPQAIRDGIAVWRVVPRSMFYLFIAVLIGFTSFMMVQPFFVVYAVKDLGIPESDWWILMTFLSLVIIVFAIPCGKLIDKVGRKKPLLLSYALTALAMLFFVFGDEFRIFIAMLLGGVGQVLAMSASFSLQADLVPREYRGKVVGFTNFMNYIAISVAQLSAGFIYQEISHQLVFFLVILLQIPALVITFMRVHEAKEREA